MGGLGAYMMSSRNPTLFSSMIPICGGGSKVFVKLLKDMPAWFAHSDDDNVVAVADTDILVEELRHLGNVRVKYTRYSTSNERPSAKAWMVGHNCWDKFYLDYAGEIADWILSNPNPRPAG